MAVFNPEFQDSRLQEYTRFSHPIGDIPADQSGLLAGKAKAATIGTIGSAIEDTTKVAENIDQDVIKDKVRTGVETQRDAFTKSLVGIRDMQANGEDASGAIKATGLTLAQNDQPDVPAGLSNGLDRAETLGTAAAQGGGKANDTLYTGALNSLAKQLRSEYPGHKDFIDEQIAKVSGKNPANAYMDNLLTDINRNATGKDVYANKLLSMGFQYYGDPAVRTAMNAVRAKLPGAMENLEKSVYGRASIDNDLATWQAQHTQDAGKRADDTELAGRQADVFSSKIVNRNFNQVLDIPGFTKPSMLSQLVQDSLEGKITLTSQQKEGLLQGLQAARTTTANQLDYELQNNGITTRAGTEATSRIKKDKLAYFDRQIENITNDKWGLTGEMRRRTDGMNNEIGYQLLSRDPQLGMVKFLNDQGGQAFANVIASKMLTSDYLGRLQNFVGETKYRASLSDDVRQDGVPKSMYSDIAAAQKANAQIKANGGKPVTDRVYDDLVENADLILTAQNMGKPEIAKEVVNYTFDLKKNEHIVDLFGRDYKDDKGNVHKGKFAVYDALSKPAIVDAVWNLKDRDSWNKVRNWQETSFKSLFGEEVKQLNTITDPKNNLNLGVKFHSDTNQFELLVPPPNLRASKVVNPMMQEQYLQQAQDSVDNLNKGLANLSYTHNKEYKDPKQTAAYITDVLMQNGYSPNDRLRGDNLPQRMIEAIELSNRPISRIEDVFKRIGREKTP